MDQPYDQLLKSCLNCGQPTNRQNSRLCKACKADGFKSCSTCHKVDRWASTSSHCPACAKAKSLKTIKVNYINESQKALYAQGVTHPYGFPSDIPPSAFAHWKNFLHRGMDYEITTSQRVIQTIQGMDVRQVPREKGNVCLERIL